MYYVYLLKSEKFPLQIYIGYTKNIKERLLCHNSGRSKHTSKYSPWKLVTCLAFGDKKQAIKFEKYLKSQAGRAFARKHFL